MKIKICGIKEPRHAITAAEAGADFIGLVFYEKSPRHVSQAQAAELAAVAKAQGIKSVALTVNADDAMLKIIADTVQPDYIQLHGDENTARIKHISALIGNGKIIKVLKIGSLDDVAQIDTARTSADLLLLDAAPLAAELPGGNARAFDWSWLARTDLSRCLLAGGLTPDNVAQAIAACHPWGIDVSSGVEESRGVKSSHKIRQFIDEARKNS